MRTIAPTVFGPVSDWCANAISEVTRDGPVVVIDNPHPRHGVAELLIDFPHSVHEISDTIYSHH